MSPQKKRQPLTPEQQATVIQWRPLACKYTLRALRAYGLLHFEDESEGLAADALMRAVKKWDPRRGSFASCLKWWVFSTVRVFRAHGARVVHQAEDSRDMLPAYSLNVSIRDGNDKRNQMTWEDLLVAETPDAADEVDAVRAFRAAEVAVTRRLRLSSGGRISAEMAESFYRVWLDREMGDDETPMHLIGWAWGVSRQMAQQRVARVQEAFEAWARPIREEAA